jgi:hypothetical protein
MSASRSAGEAGRGHDRGFCDVYRIPDLGRSRGVFARLRNNAAHDQRAGWPQGFLRWGRGRRREPDWPAVGARHRRANTPPGVGTGTDGRAQLQSNTSDGAVCAPSPLPPVCPARLAARRRSVTGFPPGRGEMLPGRRYVTARRVSSLPGHPRSPGVALFPGHRLPESARPAHGGDHGDHARHA